MRNLFINTYMVGKRCSKCKAVKSLDSFRSRKEGKLKLHSQCRSCENEGQYTEERLKYLQCYYSDENNRNKRTLTSRRSHLKIKYNLTLDQYDDMWIEQLGLCLLCKTGDSGRKLKEDLLIDHNHATSVVRGLICHQCNIGVGFIEKRNIDPSLVASYLQGEI